MAETVSIEGQPYLKRNPLGVLGFTLITLGIYFLYWLLISTVNGLYIQEHLNRIWARAARVASPPLPVDPSMPSPPLPGSPAG